MIFFAHAYGLYGEGINVHNQKKTGMVLFFGHDIFVGFRHSLGVLKRVLIVFSIHKFLILFNLGTF
jgi:hypothetical protein